MLWVRHKKRRRNLCDGLIDRFSPLKQSTHSSLICVRGCFELILRRGQKVVTHPHTRAVIDEAAEAVEG